MYIVARFQGIYHYLISSRAWLAGPEVPSASLTMAELLLPSMVCVTEAERGRKGISPGQRGPVKTPVGGDGNDLSVGV